MFLSSRRLPILLCLAILRTSFGTEDKRPQDKTDVPAPKPDAEQRSKAFKWFNNLGFVDVKDRWFVRVTTGKWFQAGNDPPRNTFVRGFLLNENGDGFTVLTLSLVEEKYEKTTADKPAHQRIGFNVIDLKSGVAVYLKTLRAPPNDDERERRPIGQSKLHARTETFVLAWACWRERPG